MKMELGGQLDVSVKYFNALLCKNTIFDVLAVTGHLDRYSQQCVKLT